MATKIEVLNDATYSQYIMISMIQVARDILIESAVVPFHTVRVNFAKQILQNPLEKINTIKSLVIVSFDTTNWGTLTETQKISGGKTLVASVFNEAFYIF